MDPSLSIGDIAERSGIAVTALRFYEANGLISSARTKGNQRRYHRGVLRRLAVIQAAQTVGFTLDEILAMVEDLPADPAPTTDHWEGLAASWRPQLETRIAMLERLRDQLDTCIGCGCLSLKVCGLLNPGDTAADTSSGAVFWKDKRR